jgi:hypothetical protein
MDKILKVLEQLDDLKKQTTEIQREKRALTRKLFEYKNRYAKEANEPLQEIQRFKKRL